jgi:fumarate reductase flavoprotein subunit
LTAAKSAYAKATGKEVKEGFKPGTYEGEAFGHGSTIRVSVKVDEDKIEAIDVLSQKETPILYDAAESKVVSAILEKQSLEVDGITGVTVSSKAIVSAVANALTNAVEDPMTLYKKVETAAYEKQEIKKEADVVVVGGGGAGLVAAISAAEEGASVIIVEKAEFLGGNLSVFGGIYNSPDAEKQDSLDMSEGEISMIEEAISATPENDDHAQAMAAVKADYEEWKANG